MAEISTLYADVNGVKTPLTIKDPDVESYLSLERVDYKTINENEDLNDYINEGCYTSTGSNVTSTLQNIPKGLYYGFKLTIEEITANTYFVQKIIENVTGYQYIRAKNGTEGWSNWISTKGFCVYNRVADIGLDAPTTILEIYKAMEYDTILYISAAESSVTDIPSAGGTLIIEKLNSNRTNIMFKSPINVGGKNDLWLGAIDDAGTTLQWNRVLTDNDTIKGKLIVVRPVGYAISAKTVVFTIDAPYQSLPINATVAVDTFNINGFDDLDESKCTIDTSRVAYSQITLKYDSDTNIFTTGNAYFVYFRGTLNW